MGNSSVPDPLKMRFKTCMLYRESTDSSISYVEDKGKTPKQWILHLKDNNLLPSMSNVDDINNCSFDGDWKMKLF